MMKAAFRTQYGPPEVLSVRELPKPVPAADEILVQVAATTVNRTDWGVLTANYFVMRFFTGLWHPTLKTTGTDFSGRVEAVGRAVRQFRPGDRVMGFNDNGLASHAEYLAINARQPIVHIPEHISYTQAAASMEGAHYALNFINKVRLEAGQKVMLNGATGAIGSAALQLLKHRGIYVAATCRTEHIELMRRLGADRVIDYTQTDFTQDTDRYDFVFDAVGKSRFGRCRQLLVDQGVYISSELGPNGENPFLAMFTPLLGGKVVRFPLPVDIKASLRYILPLLRDGHFRPLIDRTYALEDIREAFRYMASEQKVGNVLITFPAVD